MLRCAFAAGFLISIGLSPAATAECTVDQYARFKLQEPIPLKETSLQSVLSQVLGCEISVPDTVNVYSREGISLGEVRGLLPSAMIVGEIGVRPEPYWVISEAQTGKEVATPVDGVNVVFNAPDHFALQLKTGILPSVRYNPAIEEEGPRVMGPLTDELLPALKNQMVLATLNNYSMGLGGDPMQDVTFRSQPAGASLWFGASFKGATEKRFGISRSQLETVKMTLVGYEDCNSSDARKEDTGYNMAIVTCEMKKQ